MSRIFWRVINKRGIYFFLSERSWFSLETRFFKFLWPKFLEHADEINLNHDQKYLLSPKSVASRMGCYLDDHGNDHDQPPWWWLQNLPLSSSKPPCYVLIYSYSSTPVQAPFIRCFATLLNQWSTKKNHKTPTPLWIAVHLISVPSSFKGPHIICNAFDMPSTTVYYPLFIFGHLLFQCKTSWFWDASCKRYRISSAFAVCTCNQWVSDNDLQFWSIAFLPKMKEDGKQQFYNYTCTECFQLRILVSNILDWRPVLVYCVQFSWINELKMSWDKQHDRTQPWGFLHLSSEMETYFLPWYYFILFRVHLSVLNALQTKVSVLNAK